MNSTGLALSAAAIWSLNERSGAKKRDWSPSRSVVSKRRIARSLPRPCRLGDDKQRARALLRVEGLDAFEEEVVEAAADAVEKVLCTHRFKTRLPGIGSFL